MMDKEQTENRNPNFKILTSKAMIPYAWIELLVCGGSLAFAAGA